MTLTQWRGTMPKYKLAEILGVSIRHYYRWEDGSAPIPHYLRLLMATAQPGELRVASEAIRQERTNGNA